MSLSTTPPETASDQDAKTNNININIDQSDKTTTENGIVTYVESFPNEKAITRRLLVKLDTRILPIFILLVLCSFLDRTNVGNAKLYNMEKDLGMSNTQYIQGLAAFYPLYIAACVSLLSFTKH